MTTLETAPLADPALEETASDPVEDESSEDDPSEDEPSDEELAEDDAAHEQSSTALLRALEREHTRHEKTVAKALGVAPSDMHLCPTCEGVGFTPEPLEPEPALAQDPFTERCERCKGNGVTLSGATSRGLREIPCQGCGGSGYVQKVEHPSAGAEFGNGPAVVLAAPPSPLVAQGDADAVADLRRRGYTIVEPITVPPAPVA